MPTKTDDSLALTQAIGGNLELANAQTGMGMNSSDPSMHTFIQGYSIGDYLNQETIETYVRNFNIIRKIVETIPDHMTRRWGQLTLGGDEQNPQIVEAVSDWMKKMPVSTLFHKDKGVSTAFNLAQKAANRAGNAAIILLANDGVEDPAEPINFRSLDDIVGMYVMDRWFIEPDNTFIYRGPFSHYRLTQYHQFPTMTSGSITQSQQLIHRSRVLWFRGNELSDYSLIRTGGLDDSPVCGAIQAFKRLQTGLQGAGRMVIDFDVIVHYIEGLWEGLEADGKEEFQSDLNSRLIANQMAKSLFKTFVADKGREEITHSTRTVTGYSDLLTIFFDDLLSQTDLEMHELFGKYTQGMNNTSKTEQENANERTQSYQSKKFDSPLRLLLETAFVAKNGPTKGKDPGQWGWKWLPLHPMTPMEEAELLQKISQYSATNIRSEIYTPEEAAKSHYSTSEINPSITIDFDEREKRQQEKKEEDQGFDFNAFFNEGEQQQPKQDSLSERFDDGHRVVHMDDGTKVKRIVDWHGHKLGIQYYPFEKRHGRMLPLAYGHIRGMKGADGMAADAYIGTDLNRKTAWAVTQLDKDGNFDEIKFFIGLKATKKEIEKLYKQVMPPPFFGGCRQVPFNKLAEVAAQSPKKTRALG